jgi:hypothetical protein
VEIVIRRKRKGISAWKWSSVEKGVAFPRGNGHPQKKEWHFRVEMVIRRKRSGISAWKWSSAEKGVAYPRILGGW